MANDSRNIYQIARKSAGLTQEAAAERLAVSVESLRAYETGHRLPGSDTVGNMCLIYNTQYLGVQHLQQQGQLLPECLQKVETGLPLEASTLRLVNRWLSFARKHRCDQLMAIAEDGRIDEAERAQFDEIMAELSELVQATMELLYTEGV